MRKPKASLYLRFRIPDGKQSPYCPTLYDSKSRLRPFWCLVKGTPEHHPQASYYKRVKREDNWGWEWVGNDASIALSQSHAAPLVATTAAKLPRVVPTAKDGYRIDDEIVVYLSNVAKLSQKIYKAYKRSLEVFRQSCQKTYVHQITKQDLQGFDTSLIKDRNEDRTRHNRVQHVVTFLRNEGGRRLVRRSKT
jgi:hypothetical protein